MGDDERLRDMGFVEMPSGDQENRGHSAPGVKGHVQAEQLSEGHMQAQAADPPAPPPPPIPGVEKIGRRPAPEPAPDPHASGEYGGA